jgi:branched-chain amino acid transport system permease protein
VGLALFYRYTKIGLGMRATAEDHQLAQSTGVTVRSIFSAIWVLSAVVAGIGGIALANVMDIYYPLPYLGIKGLIVALVGGLDSLPGALLAGLLLGVLENVSAGYLDPVVGGGVKEVAAYVLLLLVLLVKPYGILGLVRIERI